MYKYIIIAVVLLMGWSLSASAQINMLNNSPVIKYKINEYKTDAELGCPSDLPTSFKNYIKQMYQKIESKASLPVQDADGKIALSFYVSMDGKVSDIRITKSSGNQFSDQAAIVAVLTAGPFGHFPYDYQSSGTTFNFIFSLKPLETTPVISNNPNNYIYQPYNTTPVMPVNPPANINPVVPGFNNNMTNIQTPVPLLNTYTPGINTNINTTAPGYTTLPYPVSNNNVLASANKSPKISKKNPVKVSKTKKITKTNTTHASMPSQTSNSNFLTGSVPDQNKYPQSMPEFKKIPALTPANTLTYSENKPLLGTNFMTNFNSLIKGSDLNMNRNPKNPMRYEYKPQFGDYFSNISSFLNTEGILPKDYHFQRFPIKYWVQPTNKQINKVIREAISDYSRYFPMQETNNRNDADLIIEVMQTENYNTTTKGRGGLEFPSLKGTVYLTPTVFTDQNMIISKLTVKHEIAHAFGVIKHSDNPDDIMFPKQRILLNENYSKGTIQDTGRIKDYEDFGLFSNRDLNTLWVLYNQWW